ncbi:hypothetical protein Moror_4580 [Moniliophthora roreri MCA 2997]|uniref:T6SS Phospholipase effector Tle1-like catalytic domain-containing protein n=2 Tax=Moniliophthora roreri TaxID=221103 RepID=V2XIN2_MONRO|nr:hypothetical protein Moror_4580 [Moniliophthora roreri MCA 2997]
MPHTRDSTGSSPPQYATWGPHAGEQTTSPLQENSFKTVDWNLDDTIPETHDRRTIVMCFDGTGDQFDDDNSNVVNFFSMLKKDDCTQQLVYYQSGIGTYTVPQIARPIKAKLQKLLDMMIGIHLDAHVMSGYEFLMQNYQSGDKICIFGFSRGAYTARALAGMIHKVGLLPRHNHQQVPFAYKMYSREDERGWQQSGTFKQAFSIDVDIELLGVWDTVGSVGVIPKRLPFTTSNTHVKYFRHAIALDERRARFMPNFWHRQTAAEKKLGLPPGSMPKSRPRPRKKESEKKEKQEKDKEKDDKPFLEQKKSLRELERKYSGDGELVTDVEEVWFAGCHCDVGGGAVPNATRNNLARIPLRWMVRQCFLLETGILFHRDMLRLIGMDPSTLHPEVKPRPSPTTEIRNSMTASTSTCVERPKPKHRHSIFEEGFIDEEDEDIKDALSPINDMLRKAPLWWILEVLPQKLKYQKGKEEDWVQQILWGNMGRARHVPSRHGVKIHRTVKLRMEAEAEALKLKKKYTPKPKWDFEPIWVD